jgi:hypothetical protein
MLARILLLLASVLLLAAAGLHLAGGGAVGGWLPGERGAVVQILWHLPGLDWIAVALAWAFVAWRGNRRFAPVVWLLALIPAGAAVAIAAVLGAAVVGAWLLAGAALLAVLGSLALPKA